MNKNKEKLENDLEFNVEKRNSFLLEKEILLNIMCYKFVAISYFVLIFLD